MSHILYRSFYSNRELESYYSKNVAAKHPEERRSAVKMCVIDDRPFIPLDNLSSYGYKISHLGDIRNVNDIAEFDLVLCDIMGVGLAFDQKLQGAALIDEIKSSFPEKIVIAYTGATMNNYATKQAVKYADELIKKDDSIERWKSILDTNIAKILNPYEIWNRVRSNFIKNNIDTKDILIFEDAYVRALVKNDRNFSLLKSAISSSSLKNDTRSVITGVISSAIFSVIMGV